MRLMRTGENKEISSTRKIAERGEERGGTKTGGKIYKKKNKGKKASGQGRHKDTTI